MKGMIILVLWVDDIREPPINDKVYIHVKSVNEAKIFIQDFENKLARNAMAPDAAIEYIDMDHDAGDYAYDGGDYIKLLDWLEEQDACYDIRIHSMNPVGRQNIERIIQRNNWTEIFL